MYFWLGVITFWLCAGIGMTIVLFYLIEKLANLWGRCSKVPWRMLEYIYYQKDFKEFVKNKERHPKAK